MFHSLVGSNQKIEGVAYVRDKGQRLRDFLHVLCH